MKLEGSLVCSQVLVTSSYPESDEFCVLRENLLFLNVQSV